MRGKRTQLLAEGTWATNSLLHKIHTDILHTSFMPFCAQLFVLCSHEQEGDAAVLHGQILSSNFVIKFWHNMDLWCFQDNWEINKN